MIDTGTTNEARVLAALVEQIDKRDEPADLLALATEIDQLGRQVALSIAQYPPQSELAAPLKPVLLAVPSAYTRTLLRASEKFDDAGSPRRAAFTLVEAMRRAFEANVVDVVGAALEFILEANDQPACAKRVRDMVSATQEPGVSRRELRDRYLTAIEALREAIDWTALEDEPGAS